MTRRFKIVFDSDLADKPEVEREERVLAQELKKAGARSVQSIRLPSTENGEKQGLDDFIVAHGTDAFDKLANAAEEVDTSLLPLRLTPHRLNENLEALDAVIAASDAHAYQRGGEVVYVANADAPHDGDLVQRAEGSPVIKRLTPQALQQLAMRVAKFEKWNERKKAHVPADCPPDFAGHYLQKLDGWRLSSLTGIVEAPTLRPDGSILQEPGFDAATGVLYRPSGNFPHIDQRPTRREALAAVEKLRRAVRGLEFATPESEAVWVAAVITALVRKAIPTAPMLGITAILPGTGKTLAADLIGIIATGHKPAAMSQGGSPDEDRKRLLAALLPGDAVLHIDNCELPIEGAALCTVLTSPIWTERLLGHSKNIAVPTNATILATGNKLTFAGDMTRRGLLCTLTSHHETPRERQFAWKADEETLRNRPELVAAALTVVLAYFAAGSPPVDALPFGSFETWQRFVQYPLLWLGAPDPCLTLREIEANDPARAELEQLLHLWVRVFGKAVVRTRDFADLAGGSLKDCQATKDERITLYELVRSLSGTPANGELNTRALGKYLLQNEGKPINGVRLVRGDDTKLKVATWRVV